MKRFTTLQAGRGIAALGVMLFHIHEIFLSDRYFRYDLGSGFAWVAWRIPFFFVLSGVVITLAHWKSIGKSSSPIDFWFKRIARLYPILWLSLTFVVVGLLITKAEPLHLGHAILSYLALPTDGLPTLQVEWTLQHEVLFYIIFGLFLWKPALGLALGIIDIIGCLLMPSFGFGYPWSFLFAPLHVLYIYGAFVTYLIMHNKTRFGEAGIIAGLALFGCIAVLEPWWFAHITKLSIIWAYGLGATLLIWGLCSTEKTRNVSVPNVLLFLADISYALYLIHYPLFSVMAKTVRSIFGSTPPAPPLFALIFIAIAMGAATLVHRHIELPASRIILDWYKRREITRTNKSNA